MKKLSFAMVLALTFPLINAQEPSKIPVFVDCTCDDAVGALYATALRDAIANSPRYTEAPGYYRTGPAPKRDKIRNWSISVVAMDDDSQNPGHSSALSVVILLGPDLFIQQFVQVCGRERAATCAARTLADLDNQVHKL